MYDKTIVSKTKKFIEETLQGAEGSHDKFHVLRVWENTKLILKTEKADPFICELAALLHDIADHKFHNGNEDIGYQKAEHFLTSLKVDNKSITQVVNIVKNVSFLGGHNNGRYFSQELAVVRDADRLDAIGAIGIARAFAYGGYKKRELYNPDIKPVIYKNKEEYKKSTVPTINHFYEKLLLLKDKMDTETGKKLAEKRHNFMLDYLNQFFKEWKGK